MIISLITAMAGQPASSCVPPRPTPWQAKQVFIDGEAFRRLGSGQLEAVIVGKMVQETPPASYPPWTTIFRQGGVATYFEDRGDWETAYQIFSDSIRLEYPGGSEALAFFQSADGDIAMGINDVTGCMAVERMIIEKVDK